MRRMKAIGEAIKLSGGPAKVAAELGVSAQAVCFWRDGKRQMPADGLARLERLCGARLRRWHFRPADWHLIWPELVGTEGAPQPPSPPLVALDALPPPAAQNAEAVPQG